MFKILNWSHFPRYDNQYEVLLDNRNVDALKNLSAVLWSEPLLPHPLQNFGETELNIYAVELKDYFAFDALLRKLKKPLLMSKTGK